MKTLKTLMLVAFVALMGAAVSSCGSKNPATEVADKLTDIADKMSSADSVEDATELQAQKVAIRNEYGNSDYVLTEADKAALKDASMDIVDATMEIHEKFGTPFSSDFKNQAETAVGAAISQCTTLGDFVRACNF